jgi:phenylacetate-CoA ligase
MDQKALQEFQEKKLRKILINGFKNVAIYREKYQNANIYPDEISTIDGFKKIPFISKDEFISGNFKNILPTNLKEKRAIQTSTSGTTGKPVSIYIGMYDVVVGLFGFLRYLKEHDINWRRDKMVLLLDLRGDSMEKKYISESMFSVFGPLFSFDNIRTYSIHIDPKKLIKELDIFQPDFIGGYVGILSHLAVLKERGFGNNVNPKAISLTGAPLDKFMRKFIEESFNSKVFESYAATESGPMAFECKKKKFHINSDLVYLEFLRDEKTMSNNGPAKLVVTKLYGEGTPIIRYTGINDIVAPSNKTCDCGLSGCLIEKIYGRENLSLIFPGDRIMLPSTITEIFSRILYEYKTRMVKQTQVIQEKINKLKIRMIIDNKIDKGLSSEKIFSSIKEGFIEKIGSDMNVDIDIKQVKKIDGDDFIISKINRNELKDKIYI